MRIALMLFILACSTTAHAKECPAEGSVYKIEGETLELRFVKATEPNAWSGLEAHLITPLRTIRYSMTASNGYSIQYLVEQTTEDDSENESSVEIFLFDENLKTLGLPQIDKSAARYIFLPGLGVQKYYNPAFDRDKEFVPTEMWRLQEC